MDKAHARWSGYWGRAFGEEGCKNPKIVFFSSLSILANKGDWKSYKKKCLPLDGLTGGFSAQTTISEYKRSLKRWEKNFMLTFRFFSSFLLVAKGFTDFLLKVTHSLLLDRIIMFNKYGRLCWNR